MELKQYLKIIKENAKLILIITLLTVLFSFVFSAIKPTKYDASLSLLISPNKTQETDDFKYNGYYALQAGEIIADSTEQWIKSPEFVSAVYQKAQLDPNFRNIKGYAKKFKADKMSSQYVEVKFETDTKEEAEKISQAITKVLNNKTEILAENSQEELSFVIVGSQPIILESRPNIVFNMIIGLIAGLFLGIFTVFGRRYFR